MKIRNLPVICLCLASLLVIHGCFLKQDKAAREKWIEYTHENGVFTVKLPGEPEVAQEGIFLIKAYGEIEISYTVALAEPPLSAYDDIYDAMISIIKKMEIQGVWERVEAGSVDPQESNDGVEKIEILMRPSNAYLFVIKRPRFAMLEMVVRGGNIQDFKKQKKRFFNSFQFND